MITPCPSQLIFLLYKQSSYMSINTSSIPSYHKICISTHPYNLRYLYPVSVSSAVCRNLDELAGSFPETCRKPIYKLGIDVKDIPLCLHLSTIFWASSIQSCRTNVLIIKLHIYESGEQPFASIE